MSIGTRDPLSPWRYRWTTHAAVRDAESTEQGGAFKAVRRACCLAVDDVAKAWERPAGEVHDLESGLRMFSTVYDLQAALSQLWCWRAERGMRG
jgi:hypothetical protein